jgi:hypothetical protein
MAFGAIRHSRDQDKVEMTYENKATLRRAKFNGESDSIRIFFEMSRLTFDPSGLS